MSIRLLRETPTGRAPSEPTDRARTGRAAAAFLFTHPTLRLIAAAASVQNAALMTLQGVALLILVQVRHLPAYVSGIVVAGMGVGGAIGAFFAPRMISRFGIARMATVAAVITAASPLALLLSGVSYRWVVYFAGYVLLGGGITLTSVTTRRYRQEVIPADSFARVQGLYGSLLMGSLPLGALLGGVLAQRIAPLAAVLGASVLFAVAATLLVAARNRGGHRMEIAG
jgi:predicted MFS family arabinose efflux permease